MMNETGILREKTIVRTSIVGITANARLLYG